MSMLGGAEIAFALGHADQVSQSASLRLLASWASMKTIVCFTVQDQPFVR